MFGRLALIGALLLVGSGAFADPGTATTPPAMNLGAMAVMLALTVGALALRKLSPTTGFFHTPAGALLIACVNAGLTALIDAVQAQGLNGNTMARAAMTAMLSLLATADPKPSAPAAIAPLVLIPLLALGGCAGAKAWVACTLGQLPQAAQPAFPSIYQALTQEDGQAAISALETIAAGMLPGQVPCIVKAIEADELAKASQVKGMRSRTSMSIVRNAEGFLARHPATACGDLPKPMLSCTSSPGIREITCRDALGNELSFPGTFRAADGGLDAFYVESPRYFLAAEVPR